MMDELALVSEPTMPSLIIYTTGRGFATRRRRSGRWIRRVHHKQWTEREGYPLKVALSLFSSIRMLYRLQRIEHVFRACSCFLVYPGRCRPAKRNVETHCHRSACRRGLSGEHPPSLRLSSSYLPGIPLIPSISYSCPGPESTSLPHNSPPLCVRGERKGWAKSRRLFRSETEPEPVGQERVGR